MDVEEKILLIGNGFDLAHGLPTTYRDFLKRIDPNNNIRSVDCDERIENMIGQPENQECLKRIQALFPSNLWYNYFLKKSNMNQNWCDFESEIEYVDRKLEKINEQLEETRLLELRNLFEQENEILFGFMRYYLSSCEPNSKADDFCILQQGEARSVFGRKTFVIRLTLGYQYDKQDMFSKIETNVDFDDFVKFVVEELNNFTKCLELYLFGFVNKLEVSKIRFINNIFGNKDLRVLTFNYTDTVFRYLNAITSNNICFIHGRAIQNENSNLVLGINEMDENIKPRFTRFRKYFQRFEKNCGLEYREWIKYFNWKDKGKTIPLGTHCRTIYIIGHSLTLNDRDILYELIMIKGMKTVIYYHSDDSRINLMRNLAAILDNKNFTELMEYKMIQFEKGEFSRHVVEISEDDI